MINPSEENLLGYLIRANEDHEQEELAAQIRTDAKLRQDCQLLQSGLALPSADEEYLDPPPLLAQRTCSLLWNKVDSGEFPKLPALPKQAASDPLTSSTAPTQPAAAPASSGLPLAMAVTTGEKLQAQDNTLAAPRRRWHWLDLAVASSVLVVIGGVLSTQILSSKTQAMRLSCQNNLQLTYAGLADYASMNGNRLPTAHERGPLAFAGMYGPTLRDSGHLQNQNNLICPETALAKDLRASLPTIKDLERAKPEELPALQRLAGGTYFYSLGYMEGGKYRAIKLRNCPKFVLISEPPANINRPDLHHGQIGHNALIQNGAVRFMTDCQLECCNDDQFLNDNGEIAPGLHEGDAVLVGSGVGPMQ